MSTHRISRLALLVGLALPASMQGQVAGAQFCESTVYNESVSMAGGGPVERMHPLLARARYAELVRNEQWEVALSGLREDVEQSFVAANVPAGPRENFRQQLDSVLSVIGRLPNASEAEARTRFISDSVRSVRFRPRQGVESYQLFRQAATIDVAALTPEQTKALCWSAMSIDLVLFRLAQPLQGDAIARLARLTTAWANYRTYGYTRQPLELLLDRGSVKDSLPRQTQWLIGHLSLGAELSGRLKDSLSSTGTSILEFGVLRYRRNYTQYYGVSGIVGLSSNRGVGYGGMVHIARSLRAGVLFRRSNGKTSQGIVVSTDLYGLLERSKKSVEDGLAMARGIVVLPPRGS